VANLQDAFHLKAGVVTDDKTSSTSAAGAREVQYQIDGQATGSGSGAAVPSNVPVLNHSWGQLKSVHRESPAPNSVGGTTPVNGDAFDAMFFQHYGVNPFVDPRDDRFATFALDVDNASYALTRAYLERDELPPPAAVRVEEFVNALDQDYAPPEAAARVQARTATRCPRWPCAWTPRRRRSGRGSCCCASGSRRGRCRSRRASRRC
jgi:hypothetical protein